MSNIKNIALMAHVDAGKTTLTEQILYKVGIIRTLGSVDEGTTKTDDLAVERQRGISVRAALTSFTLDNTTINLIDTPGHSDFYSQVERTFLAIDAVIILVSAVDGVQSGTETIAAKACEDGVPVMFFVNKCDRDLAQKEEAAAQIKSVRDGAFEYMNERYETAALYDDGIMQAYFDEAQEDVTVVNTIITNKIKTCEIAPILFGSAATGEGVSELLRFVCDNLPTQDNGSQQDKPSGVVFSVSHDKLFGRGAYVRLFSGCLTIRDIINTNSREYKISMIKQQINGRWVDVKELKQGDIALVYGLTDCKTGDIFGDELRIPKRILNGLTKKALLTTQISPENEGDNIALKAALEMLTAEDPMLKFVWEPTFRKMQINIMGVIQMEILTSVIEERFGIKARVGEPSVIYKETLAKPSIGFDAYTMPKPSWAILKFQLTPSDRGSGISYKCTAPPNRIPYRYRGQIEQSIIPSLKQGLYGWEVTDINIDLVDGEDHPVHTHPLDFTIATPLALMNGLKNGGTILLEPIMDVKLSFDSTHFGKVASDIIKMRGSVESSAHRDENVIINAKIPLATSLNYPVVFASTTSGRGIITQKLYGYEECPLELGKTCARRGVDPFERSKYILAARHALAGTVFGS